MAHRWSRMLAALLLGGMLAACAPSIPPVVITVVVSATPGAAGADAAALAATVSAADAAIPDTAQSAPTDTPQVAAAAQVADTPTPEADLPTAASGPLCTILQNINVRKGPGKVYGDPIDSFVTGTVVIPQGYVANGFPGGSWVQVRNPSSNRVGWVSAGSDYVNCTVDLTQYAQVDVPPTPKPSAPALSNSQPGGNFDDNWHAKLHLSGSYLARFEVNYRGEKDGDNIQDVTFVINAPDDSTTLWQHKESKAPYCIYGGDSGCAAWPKASGALIWDPNNPGSLVKSGDYKMTIIVDATDPDSQETITANWTYDRLTVKLP